MNALEAMTRLIEAASHYITEEGGPADPDMKKDLETAAAVAQAMLNTAIPIARFRMHVSLPESMPEFTVSSPSTKALVEVLQLIREKKKNQLITASLWEQHPQSAEMLHGFEGNTRADGFKYWIKQVKDSQDGTQVQAVVPESIPLARSKADAVKDAPGAAEEGTEAGS